MGVAASSSSSSSKKYEVFLSFRGEDTRRSFTSHLHTALCLKGIETFIDYELQKGDDISQSLIKAIQDSSLSVIVFSENYASSKWCLNELLEILRCKEKGQLVVPIFYQVDPSHVRHQRGAYEEAFAQHWKKNPDKVDEWRKALFETANLAGWDSCNCRDEAELIQNIVNDIIKKLNHGSSSAFVNIVGIQKNCAAIESLLEGFSTIGIWGMGGIGKTTMAKVVFAKFHSQFDSCYFLDNFREEADKHGLKYIRDKLVNELSNDKSLERLSLKKVLIVLDDVSDTSQLDYLENEAPLFGLGSKVIITSRDKHVLDGRVEGIHEAVALGHANSRELFNLKAFRKDGYKSEYEELVERALAYAKGVPLALTVLGSYLHSRTIEEWKSALSRLQKTTLPSIQDVLKLSYDGLLRQEKEAFLDIACFFKGESKEYVMAMLESFEFYGPISLRNLVDKALISVVHGMGRMQNHGTVWMHDLIQSMAFEIVCQECLTNPGRRSRLWNHDEIYDVLKYNQGSDAIQGISLNMSQIRDLHLSADSFKKMTNLRFLKFYSSLGQKSCTVNLPSGLDSFSRSLRYLQWDNFPSQSLPLSSCAEKIVQLHMPNSHLKRLWDGVQNLVNLREINLRESKYLMELPDLSTAQNLERLNLSGCKSLSHLDPSILSLPRLHDVCLNNCKSLKSLKTEDQSKSISSLSVYNCRRLKEFSFSSKKLEILYIEHIPVEILHFPSGHMENLWSFHLNCSKLKNLPIDDMICCMRSLQTLCLWDCGGIIDKSKLHALFDSLLSLETIWLTGACKLTELPPNIKHLSRLRELIVNNCQSLQSLPELPPSIEELTVNDCTSLKTLQLTSHHIESSMLTEEIMLGPTLYSSVSYLRNLLSLALRGCEQLCELPESIESVISLWSLDLRGSNIESLPASFKHLLNLREINLSNCRRLRSLSELPLSLDVSNYKSLQSLPELPSSIQELRAGNCTSSEDEIILGSTLYSSISYLRNLSNLTLSGYEQLYELPESIGSLFSLQSLDLKGSNIESLPASIKHLLYLRKINLSNCRRLCSFPELPFFINTINADGCILLEIVPTLATAPYLRSLLLKDCLKLESRYMESACFPLKQAIYTSWKAIYRMGACKFCYPGRKVPEWFKSNQGIDASNNISMELPSTTTDLIGFVLCSVLSHHVDDDHLQCQLYYDGKKHICSYFEGVMTNFDSHHVFLWCVSNKFINFSKTMDAQKTNYRPNVSFEFSVVTGSEIDSETDGEKFVDGVIEACGVCPIYASEYLKFIQQMELEANSAAQKETCQDADENSFHGTLKYANFSLKAGKCGNLEGSNIPEWFIYKSSMIVESSGLYATVPVAPDFDKLMGFIFCFVIPNFSSKEWDRCYSTFGSQLEYEGYYEARFNGPSGWHYSMRKLNSDDAFLWYDPFLSECILKRLKNLRRIKGCDAKPDLKFFFNLGYGLIHNEMVEIRIDNCLIKEYGVRPIYVSEYTNFLREKKLKEVKDSSIDESIPKNYESSTSHDVDELLHLLAQLNF